MEYEQKGKARAEYAEETLKQLSKRLVAEFGQGYSERNLRLMRQFYRMYGKKPQSGQHVSGEKIWQTLSAKSAIGQKKQTLSGQSEFPKLQTPSVESVIMALVDGKSAFLNGNATKIVLLGC